MSNIKSAQCKYGPMSWYTNDAYIGRSLDLYGEYSEGEVDLFRKILTKESIVLEAGANIGALTVPLAQMSSYVHAFEPQPEYFSLLKYNTEPLSNVTLNPQGLSKEPSEICIQPVDMEMVFAPGWKTQAPSIKVKTRTIDSLGLERLDLIKIDVDGLELEILKGAEGTINYCRPFLYVENDKPECYPGLGEWIANKDYRLYTHFSLLFSESNYNKYSLNVFGNTGSQMLLCVPNEMKRIFPGEWSMEIDKQIISIKYK